MIRVWTPSRLHFGLLSLAGPGELWADPIDRPALAARRFGGVGLMVQAPGVQVHVRPADTWSAEGPLAARAMAFAQRLVVSMQEEYPRAPLSPQHILVEQAGPEHAGLGTGTQLGLAVGRAVMAAWGLAPGTEELARRVGRGLRSALGAHGFAQGGLLVEAGKRQADDLGPLVARLDFPEAWLVVLARPVQDRTGPGMHGQHEQDAFVELLHQPGRLRQTEALCRLVLLGMLPALVERDLDAFGEALFDFNARVGEIFAPVQGGVYAGPAVTELVTLLRGWGVRGVGQSSWGPTVFAITAGEEQARDLVQQIQERYAGQVETTVTQACNHGAIVTAG